MSGVPVSTTIDPRHFTGALLTLLEETFVRHHGVYIDKGTSLLETLASIDAQTASRPGRHSASIASHVSHTILHLEVMANALRQGGDERVDWGQIWREAEPVSSEQWAALREKLRATYERVVGLVRDRQSWDDEDSLTVAIGLLAHAAYHLGAIRQAYRVLQ